MKKMGSNVQQMQKLFNIPGSYFCPNCIKFEKQTLSELKKWLKKEPINLMIQSQKSPYQEHQQNI